MLLSVLQWNIWYKEPITNIAQFLKDNPADIICLQELMHNWPDQEVADTSRYIAEALGYDYQEIILEHPGEDWGQANGIFTKLPIIESKKTLINDHTGLGGYSDENRGYLEVTVGVGGKDITVATTHMSFTEHFVDTPRKQVETDKLISHFKDRNYILTGDLNATPHSQTVKSIEKHLRNAGPGYKEATWTTKPFLVEDFSAKDLDWRLDYVFASSDIQISSAKVLQTTYSDHLPLLVTVNI
jgi:endonuclease/exonuclease/phosphatase family metal-dependent hydrolase